MTRASTPGAKTATTPPTVDYTIQPDDTYPSIAEQYGHSGEWQVLVALNPPPADPLIAWMDPGAPVLGVVIQIPSEWASATRA